MIHAAFAIPGNKEQRTGGYIYDATVLRMLIESGHSIAHIELCDTFPTPSAEHLALASRTLAAIPASCPIIVDGLALGAMIPESLDQVTAPIIALVHHPLGLETGIEQERAAAMIQNETDVLRRAAHVIVPSAHIAHTVSEILSVPPDQITVALPGFERPAPSRSKISPPLILAVGLLAPRKGHDVLINALQDLTDLPWQAEIIGRFQDKVYTAALQAQIEQAGLAKRVCLSGEVSPSELEDAYRRASIFALATRYEGYGMVLSEAMCHALPVVSCAVGAVPSTVGKAAHLVPPDDPKAFAAALRSLLEDPEKMAHSARASAVHAASLSGWQDTVAQFVKVISKVAS